MAMNSATRLSIAIAALVGAIGIAAVTGWRWQQRKPSELQTLQAVIERISRGNDLGSEPITFMVGAGTASAHLAEQRGLCKPDKCDFFSILSPYRKYNYGWDEMVRQAYSHGDAEAYSTSNGTIVLAQAAFRVYGHHSNYLACVVAHEIAHIRREHGFQKSYQEHHNFGKLADAQKKLAMMRLSRSIELEADRDSADMLSRAGYPGRLCENGLKFTLRSSASGFITEPESDYPGYDERLKAMAVHYHELAKKPLKPQHSTVGSFHYDISNNLLTFYPKSTSSALKISNK